MHVNGSSAESSRHIAVDHVVAQIDHVGAALAAPVHARGRDPLPALRAQRRQMRPAAGAIAVETADRLGDRPQIFRTGPRREVHAAIGERTAVEPFARTRRARYCADRPPSIACVDRVQEMHGLVGHAVARKRDHEPQRQIGPNAAEQPEPVRRKIPRIRGRDRAQPDRRDEVGFGKPLAESRGAASASATSKSTGKTSSAVKLS